MTRNTMSVALVLAVLSTACDGGESASGGKTGFAGDSVPAGPVVFLRSTDQTTGAVELDVVARDIPNLYGVAFRLKYPAQAFSAIILTRSDVWPDGTLSPSTFSDDTMIAAV